MNIKYYIGFCADEQRRFKRDIYPIADFDIKESQILEWAKDQPIFNDYYKTNRRCGCYMCPMASMVEDTYLYTHYPQLFSTKMAMAAKTEYDFEQKHNRPFSVWQPNPKYNTEYRVQRILEGVTNNE